MVNIININNVANSSKKRKISGVSQIIYLWF